MDTNLFGGTGEYHTYRNFNVPIPARMKNAISSELNAAYIGRECVLPVPEGVDTKKLIPCWLIVLWAEMGLLKRLPNVGVGTLRQTLEVIATSLTED